MVWAGSSLGPLIYLGLFHQELGDLWSSLLVAPAINANAIPPQATRLHVVVDAGILRREDYTAERTEHVRCALEATAGEAWPEYYHVGMELHLPEPVRREEGGDEDGDRETARGRRSGGGSSSLRGGLGSALCAWIRWRAAWRRGRVAGTCSTASAWSRRWSGGGGRRARCAGTICSQTRRSSARPCVVESETLRQSTDSKDTRGIRHQLEHGRPM